MTQGSTQPAEGQPPQSGFSDKLGLLLGVGAAIVLLFFPLGLVYIYDIAETPVDTGGAAEATVGVAVIVRAAARRVLTTTVSSILRTAFATFSRTVARTVMRRLMRFMVRALFGVLTREATWSLAGGQGQAKEGEGGVERRKPVIPLALGAIALSLSFFGVVAVTGTIGDVTLGGQLSLLTVALLAGLPLVVYGIIHLLVAPRLGVNLRFNTAFDGLLLQAYFTGAGSFLPMTTDVEYTGSQRGKMWLAAISLGSLFAIHLILLAVASVTGNAAVSFASGAFLVFCFVYVFPIKPLEGYDIFVENKLLWVAIWFPVLVSFFFSLPPSLSATL